MRAHLLSQLAKSQNAAVAPTVALSLFGLIAVGGIAFDYARMATMDTELQAAADQAALAAASQLDGKTGTCERAARAAVNLVANQTRFANEAGGNLAVTVPLETGCDQTGNVRFYKTKDRAVATTDADAKFVEVTVNTREAFFSLTPIVAALSSGALSGTAFAGLGSAICKVPPVMMCNPKEGTDPNFTTSDYIGRGILLVTRQNKADAYGPGNFGFLNTGYDAEGGGTALLRKALGQENFVANCSPTEQVITEPGQSSPAVDAINRRFDILSANTNQNDTCGSGQCPPSVNTRKDLVKQGTGNNSCTLGSGGSPGWKEPTSGRYLPTSATADLTAAQLASLSPMGHPRDKCHAFNPTSGCTGTGSTRVGTSDWDRNAYFYSNFGSGFAWQAAMMAAYGKTAVTRYEVYKWEIIAANRTINPGGISVSPPPVVAPGTSHSSPICEPPGREPVGDLDRRLLTMAVINCNAENVEGGLNGRKSADVTKWVDVFLVEPSIGRDRTTANDIYVEVVKERDAGSNGTGGGTVRRDVPYLIE